MSGVRFDEDHNRVSTRHGAKNLAMIRLLASSLLKQHPNERSIPCKRLMAAIDTNVLEEVIRGDRKPRKL